jgi:hypothetical protein
MAQTKQPPRRTPGDVQASVQEWRAETRTRAGYGEESAQKLAESSVDLHLAVRLVEQGCEPELAATILL